MCFFIVASFDMGFPSKSQSVAGETATKSGTDRRAHIFNTKLAAKTIDIRDWAS